MIRIRVEPGIELVADVRRVRSHIRRSRRRATVIVVRVEPRVKLVAYIGAVRAVVGRGRVCGIETLAISIDGSDTGICAVAAVAVLKLIDALVGDLLVLSCAGSVAGYVVEGC